MLLKEQTRKAESTKLPITRPIFDSAELQAVEQVLESGWLVQGPRVAQFEQLFADFVQAEHAIATTSCTTALHLALLAAGIGRGDEVLLPSFTFVATANAIEYTGARPIFIDIDLETLTIDAVQLREYLEQNSRRGVSWPRAIIPVSLFGLCANMEAISQLAEEFDLTIIEDAACGLGAERTGHHAGTEALAGCFSLHPRKAITTGEGGMIVTNDAEFAATARMLRDHGASKTDLERHLSNGGSLLPNYDILGFNYRMTDLQGAIGVAQMGKLDSILEGRMAAAARYTELLSELPFLNPQTVPSGYRHAYQSYVCLFQPRGMEELKRAIRTGNWSQIDDWNRTRNRIMAQLESDGISVRQGTHAVHLLGYYHRKYALRDIDYPNAFVADRLTITLPLYSGMREADQLRVFDTLRSAMKG
ncbi:MAG: DegT/DnrJ/EryC1/StrS aminotransferase family protein [bacterium]|nr:DegT/DnrJ/EryC1/StrS aminotransferase family protein [bacterium]